MYEDTNTSVNWRPFFIKGGILVLSILLLFLIMGFFSNNVSYGFYYNFDDNLNSMKEAALEYYTGSNLPSNIGDTDKLTLKEMINENLIDDFTSDSNGCSLLSSYAKITKVNESEYSITINLECTEESDFLITTIEK